MAANVPLTLSVETVGTEGIQRLKDDVAALGKQGAAAAPEFQQLGAEIDKLSKQAGLTGMMKSLVNEVDALSAAQQKSAETSSNATAALRLAETSTGSFAEVQRGAKLRLEEMDAGLRALRLGLAEYKNESTNAEKETKQYTETVKTFNSMIIEAKRVREGATAALKQAKAATAEATAAENELAASAQKANSEAARSQDALQKKSAVLREVSGLLRQAGIETTTLAETEGVLIASYQALQKEIGAVSEAIEAKLAAEKRAAQEEERLILVQISKQNELRAAAALAAQEIIGDYDKMAAAQATMANATKVAGDALNNAFSTVGVRSVAAIRAEIETVNASLATLASKGGLTGAELRNAMASAKTQVNALEKEIRTMTGALTLADKASNLFAGSMGQFAAGNLMAQGIAMLVMKIGEYSKAMIDSMIAGDQMRRGMQAVYGDAKIAASQMKFLRDASFDAGVSFESLGSDFVRFSASMKSANIDTDKSNALFKALTTSSAVLGLSTEDTAGALNALGQMASKGTVQMEELRGQLGDRLPGVMGTAAKAMGITEKQLNDLVVSGGLATRDFITPFTEGLNKLKGDTEGVTPSIGKLKSTLSEMSQLAGDAGGLTVMMGAVKFLGGALAGLAFVVGQVIAGIGLFGTILGQGVAAIVTFTNPLKEMNATLNATGVSVIAQLAALKRLFFGTTEAATGATAHAAATAASSEQMKVGEVATLAAATGHTKNALEMRVAADATLLLTQNGIQYSVVADELISKQAVITDGLAKGVKATKEQGVEMVTLAKLSGDAAQLRDAEATAAENEARALQLVADSQRAEVEMLIASRAQKIKNAEAANASASAIASETAELDKKLAKALPELEQMQHAADAARAEAVARNLANEALKDNSALVDSSAALMRKYTAEVEALKNAEAQGVDVKDLLHAAQVNLSEATFIYNDGLKDNIDKIKQKSALEQTAAQITIAVAQANQSNNSAMATHYKALGDNATAQYYEIAAKQDAIKVIRLQMDMARAANAVRLLEIEGTLKNLTGTDDLTRAKVNALEVEKGLLKVKNIGNDAMKNQITLIESEIDAIRNGVNVRKGSTDGIDTDTNSRNKNADAINRQNTALQKQKNLTSDGFEKNADGSAKGTFGSTTANMGLYELQQKQNAGSLAGGDLEKAQAAYQKAIDNKQWLDAVAANSPGAVSTESVKSTNEAITSAQDILNRVKSLADQAVARAPLDELAKKLADATAANKAAKSLTSPEALAMQERINALERSTKSITPLNASEQDSAALKALNDAKSAATKEQAALNKQEPAATAENYAYYQDQLKQAANSGQTNDVLEISTTLKNMKKTLSLQGDTSSTTEANGAGSYTVNINMGATSSKINLASKSDADALAALLQQIGTASTRAA